jgi:hypothetical protein
MHNVVSNYRITDGSAFSQNMKAADMRKLISHPERRAIATAALTSLVFVAVFAVTLAALAA